MKKLYSLAIGFLIANSLYSQWNPDPALNNPLCIQPYEQVNVKIISDLKGGAIAVWEDFRNDPALTNADIYAQRINSAGKVMWQTNGVAICTDVAHQAAPTIVTDSSGGAIIVWQDHRGTKVNLYAQRIDSSGNVLWTVNGIPVTARNFDQRNPKILNDRSHGAIVIWQDSVGGTYDIYAQRLDPNGSPLWTNGVAVCSFLGSQSNPKAQITAIGDIFVSWQDKRNGADYDIYVQKLNLSGVAQLAANGISICNFAGTQSNPKVALDNTGGAIVSWQDKRNGLDYDVYAQRINSAGAIQWAANGVSVCNATGSQSAIDLTTQNVANGVIIAWKDSRAGVNNVDVYAQKLNLGGIIQWPLNGIVIANGNYNQLSPNVITDDAGGAIVAYQDSSSGNWNIKSQRVSPAGTLLWTIGGVNVGIAAGDQTNHSNISVESGNSIYAFQDLRSGTNDIYIYKLSTAGKPLGIVQLTGVKAGIIVYPNPSSDKVTFILPNANEKWILKVINIDGREIISEEINNSDKFEMEKKFGAGVYFFKIQNSTSSFNGKFIIVN